MDEWQKSVTELIAQLKKGDAAAAAELWQRYFDRLVQLASKRLGVASRRIADEEDVVISVFDTLCRGAAKGRFKELTDRDDLWRLLLAITRQKSVNQVRRQASKKRGSGTVRGESTFVQPGGDSLGLDTLMADAPTPELLVELDDQLQQLLAGLRDDVLRRIAVWRIEGYSNEDIAEKEGVTVRSVERKMQLIRSQWLCTEDAEA